MQRTNSTGPGNFPTFDPPSGPTNLPIPAISPSRIAPPGTTAERTSTLPTTETAPASGSAAPLRKLHGMASANAASFPGASHAAVEKEGNLRKQASMKDLGRLEIQISKTRQARKKAEKQGDAKTAGILKKELHQLTKQKSSLIDSIAPARHAYRSSKSGSTASSTEDSTESSPAAKAPGEQLTDVLAEISECKAELKSARKAESEKRIVRLENKLKALVQQRKQLESLLNTSGSEESRTSHSSELHRDLDEIDQDIRQCEASLSRATKRDNATQVAALTSELKKLRSERQQLARELASTSTQSKSETTSSTESASEAPSAATLDPLATVRKQIDERLKKIGKLDQQLASPKRHNPTPDDVLEQQKEKQALEEEVGHLKTVLRFLEIQQQGAAGEEVPSVSTSPAPPARVSSLSKMVRTATAHRRRHVLPPRSPAPSENDTLTPLKNLHDKTRNSTLLMPEDVKQYFSKAALEEIEALDQEIENIADNVDLMLETRRRQQRPTGPDGQADDPEERQENLQALDKRILKSNLRLGKLIEQREKLESKVLPAKPGLTAKEQAAQYKAFLERYKSEKTRGLEKKHAEQLAQQAKEWASGCAEWGLQSLAGFTANFGSFFIGNSIARALAIPVVGSVVSMPVAAFLHVMVGGPIVKQVLNRTWSAPVLVEFNNYFKLLGASWADRANGEENVRKYASKNPDLKEKLTIGERLAEERGFWAMLWDRYKTEEVGYYAYTMNYGFKALAAGALATAMDPKGSTFRAAEWAMHGVMGWMSGAEYVVSMQAARSQIPGASQAVLPNRATSAAEANALQSLLNDLQQGLAASRAQLPKDPTDPTERDLLKAIRKTEKALAVARRKSEFLGTFAHEFTAQFATKEAVADTLSESLGRTISLAPVAVLGEFLGVWRNSGNFWLTSAAHALQALLLIMPPGFTARPLYSGLLRALMQAGLTEKDTRTTAPGQVRGPQPSGSTATPDAVSLSDQGDESTIIDGSSTDSDDDEGWHGNPTDRDREFDW